MSITVLLAWSSGLMAKLHVLLCFHTMPWQAFEDGGRNDNYYRLRLEVHRKETFGPWNAKGLSHESLEECALHSGIIQTARYSVLSRFTVYLLKLLRISATWKESLSISELILRNQERIHIRALTAFGAEKQSHNAQSSALFVWSHDYITRLLKHTKRVWLPLSLAAIETKCTPARGSPRQELAHVAQLIPQWTGGWAWCHPLPCVASPAPYKDLHHMVLMALSLLAQVGCFSTGVGLRVCCRGHIRSKVCGYCCFAAICAILYFRTSWVRVVVSRKQLNSVVLLDNVLTSPCR